MSKLDRSTKVLVAIAALNIALSLVALAIEGPVPSAVVYPAVLAVGIWRALHAGRSGSVYFLVAGVVFLLVHVTFLREALSSSCVHPFDSTRACNESLWLLWLGLGPLALSVAAAVSWLGERRGRDTADTGPAVSRPAATAPRSGEGA